MSDATQKAIVFTAPDGSKWAVAAEVVAHSRAEYYADSDSDTTYQDEFDYTIGSDYELKDWLEGNMNCEDVEPYAVKVKEPKPSCFADAFARGHAIKALDPSWNLPKPSLKAVIR